MSTKHTPGPWTSRDVLGAGLEIYGPVSQLDGVTLSKGMPPEIGFFTLTQPQTICIATERWVQFEPVGWHEMQEANARLIAAAPDLYAELERLVNYFGPNSGPPELRGKLNDARAALSKAIPA